METGPEPQVGGLRPQARGDDLLVPTTLRSGLDLGFTVVGSWNDESLS